MPHSCVAGNCCYVAGKDVSLHEFPHNRPDVLRKWVEFVQVNRKDFWMATKHSHLCSDHFIRDDYANIIEFEMGFSSKRRLKPDAVPSLHKNPPARAFPPTTLALSTTSTTSSASDSAAAVTRTHQSKKRPKNRRRNLRKKYPDPMASPCSPDTGQSTSTTPKPSCPWLRDRSTFGSDEPLKKRLRKTLVTSENANKGLCEAEDVHNLNNAPLDTQQTKDAEGLGILALAVENRRQEEALDGLPRKGMPLQEASTQQIDWKEPGSEAHWKPREQNHANLLHLEVGVPSPVPNLNLGYSDNSQQQTHMPTLGNTALSPPEPSSSESGAPDLPLPDHLPEVRYTASASSSWPAEVMLIKSEPESPDLPKLGELLPEVRCTVAAAIRWPAEIMSIKSELEEPGLSPPDELLPEVRTAELLSIKSEPEEPGVPSREEFLAEVSSTVIAANRWPTEGVSIKSEPQEPGLPSPDELCPEVGSASVAANRWPVELVSMKSEPESPGLPPSDELLPEIRSTAVKSEPDLYNQSCAANCAGGTTRTPCSGCDEKDELIRLLQAQVSSLQEELAATTCKTCSNNRVLKRQQAWQQFAFKDSCPKPGLRSSNTFQP